MNETIIALEMALVVLKNARYAALNNTPAFMKLANATRHIESQLAAMIAE